MSNVSRYFFLINYFHEKDLVEFSLIESWSVIKLLTYLDVWTSHLEEIDFVDKYNWVSCWHTIFNKTII